MGVSEIVSTEFNQRLQAMLELIARYSIEYEEVGLFGSYARGDYRSTSDIDLCVITNGRPERSLSGALREEAEALRVDIVFISPQYFLKNDTLFARNLRKDYRRVL